LSDYHSVISSKPLPFCPVFLHSKSVWFAIGLAFCLAQPLHNLKWVACHLKPKKEGTLIKRIPLLIIAMAIIGATTVGCAGGPLSTREKAAGIGTLGGAATGAIIGSTVGHAGSGAAIGGALGLGAGALIGDQLQGHEIKNSRQDGKIRKNQPELGRQRQQIEKMVRHQGEY
jgi:hypothetical protein